MFKNIQKYLLINQPLLWNLKIIPLIAFLIFFNFVYFVLGYLNGAVDFTDTDDNFKFNANDPIILFLGALIAVLAVIIWAVYYLKNNALKSNYPKTKYSLFIEWLFLLLIAFCFCFYNDAYFIGKDSKVKSYFTKTEAKKRCEIISIGYFFTEASYASNDYIIDNEATTAWADSIANKSLQEKFFKFEGKNYNINSLVNKNTASFTFFNTNSDSLRNRKIRNWLVTGQKDSIKSIFKKYLAIGKEHNLSASIDENKWFDLIYFPSKFDKFVSVAKQSREPWPYVESPEAEIDSTQYLKKIGKENYLFNKYYVPGAALQFNYNKISNSFEKPIIDENVLLLTFYFALAISLIIFSFRITSIKNWLIAGVSIGVLAIIIGIISVIFKTEYIYYGSIFTLFLILTSYFFMVINRKKGKSLSGVTLNIMLWTLPSFAPTMYVLIVEISKVISGYKQYRGYNIDGDYPKIHYFDQFRIELFYFNAIFTIVVFFLFTIKIKQWRALAES